jgi:DNA-binding NtrC family response regulator
MVGTVLQSGKNSSKTILIVDDEPDLLDILKFSLEGEGYRILTASSVRDAVSLIQKDSVHLVITDVRMPEGDGMQILSEGKLVNPDLAVILMTGFADVNPTDALQKGAAALLSKPFDHGRLLALVRLHLGAKH